MKRITTAIFAICVYFAPPSYLQAQESSWTQQSVKEEFRYFGLEDREKDVVPETSVSDLEQKEESKQEANDTYGVDNMYAASAIPPTQKRISNLEDVPEQGQPAVKASDLDLDAIKENFLIFGNITALGSYSALINNSSITGGNVSGYLAPAYKISEKMFFIFLMNGMYNKSKQVYVQDDGPRLSTETRSYSITPTLKYSLSETLSISPSLIYTKSQARQDGTVRWGDDLYDYTEIGGSMVLEASLTNTDEVKRNISLTAQGYHRNYPNYTSLLTLAGFGSLEEREKDFDGFLAMAGYTVSRPLGLSYKLNGNVLYKKFSDKLVENESGERNNYKQKDMVVTLGTNLDYKPMDSTSLLLDLTYIYNWSNQNLSTGTFPANEYTRNYHIYHNLIISPGVEHTMQVIGRDLILKGQYSYSVTQYTGRNAKSDAGVIVGKEKDFTHELSFNATFKFNKELDFLLSSNVQRVRSNMKEETTFRYNYSLFNFSLGLSYSF